MDSPKHDESSSSRSVRVEKLTKRKRGRPGEEIEVSLSDASSFFVSLRVWEEAPFYDGDELTPEHVRLVLSRSRYHAAYARALDLLSRSEHSRFLLRQKLLHKGLSEESVDPALDALESEGALDDQRYAESWIRSRLRSNPEGRVLLLAHVRERGVPRSVAEDALDAVVGEEKDIMVRAARSVVDRLQRRGDFTELELRHKLYRRGFSPGIISVVAKLMEPDDIDYPTEFEG